MTWWPYTSSIIIIHINHPTSTITSRLMGQPLIMSWRDKTGLYPLYVLKLQGLNKTPESFLCTTDDMCRRNNCSNICPRSQTDTSALSITPMTQQANTSLMIHHWNFSSSNYSISQWRKSSLSSHSTTITLPFLVSLSVTAVTHAICSTSSFIGPSSDANKWTNENQFNHPHY